MHDFVASCIDHLEDNSFQMLIDFIIQYLGSF